MSQVCTSEALVSISKCFGSIPHEMEMPVLIKIFCEVANMNCTAETLVTSAKCLACIPKEMQMPTLIYLACQILNNGTGDGSGETCITCGEAAPTEASDCDCAIYYTKGANAGVWIWNATGATWETVIAPGP